MNSSRIVGLALLLVGCGHDSAQPSGQPWLLSETAPPGSAGSTGVGGFGGPDNRPDFGARDVGVGPDAGSAETGDTGRGRNLPPGHPAPSVVAGHAHTCALHAGAVKCWGANRHGQLGLGDRNDRGDEPGEMGDDLPRVDLGGQPVQMLAAGYFHTCALLAAGRIKCWGDNGEGQLGVGDDKARGDAAGEMGTNLPFVHLGTGRTAVSVVAGDFHTCAVLDDGSVKCWGENDYGQLGLGDTTNRGAGSTDMGDNLPTVDLGAGRTAVEVATGGVHTCALLDDGSVKCWGDNQYGQLGAGDFAVRGDESGEMGDALPTVRLGPGRSAVALAAGFDHTCALLDNGSVKCWGYNAYGQLGLGDVHIRGGDPAEMGRNLPAVNVGAGRTVRALSAGLNHTCAILDDDSLKCWGDNTGGDLGLGDVHNRGDGPGEMGDNLPSIRLGSGRVAIFVVPGDYHTCARLDDGSTKCWGNNGSGQLGLGDVDARGNSPDEMGDNLPSIDLGSF